MWFLWMCVGAGIGVLGFAVIAAGNRCEDCLNCSPLIEANQTIEAREADIRALGEDIKKLQRANAALRGYNKRLVWENQQAGFLHAKEA